MKMYPDWLACAIESATEECYLMEAGTMRILHANPAACHNLGYSARKLAESSLPDVTAASARETLADAVRRLAMMAAGGADLPAVAPYLHIDTTHRRHDGSEYALRLRLFLQDAGPAASPCLIGVGLPAAVPKHAGAVIPEPSFDSFASNMPGMIFQFVRHADGRLELPYVSRACITLLDVSPSRLKAYPALLQQMILPEDRPAFVDSLNASAAEMTVWNWEGRFWIAAWQDIKWINLRATPQPLPGGGAQWIGLMNNVTQSKLEEAELKRSREQLAELSAHIEMVKEKERTHLSREIHDDLGGNLTAIKMALALLTRRLPADNSVLHEKAAYVESLVDRTIESAHRIAGNLRPGILDLGLVAALQWQAHECEKQLGASCTFVSNVTELDLDPDHAVALFRIVQEALTNIGKHADASVVRIRLAVKPGNLLLEIIDNGRGISHIDLGNPKSFGIRGMTERMHALGGDFCIGPVPNGGTTVSIALPLPE